MLSWLFPTYCVLCSREGTILCIPCKTSIDHAQRSTRCIYCTTTLPYGHLCPKHHSHCTDIFTIFRYGSLEIRKVLEQFKYHNRPQLANVIAAHMATFLSQGMLPKGPTPILCPLPSPPKRHGERSYTPTVLIAEALGKLTGFPTIPLLHCTRNPRKQATLTREERQQNVAGLFRLSYPEMCLDNKTILLIDDVITTGSTIESAAETLRQHQAAHIYGITFAQNT